MKKFILLLPLILFFSCAKPPQIEIEKAHSAYNDTSILSDVITYAAKDLAIAKVALDDMDSAVKNRKYDEAKTLSMTVVITCDVAKKTASDGKAMAMKNASSELSRASLDIEDLRIIMERARIAAKKNSKIKLDFQALDDQFNKTNNMLLAAKSANESGKFIEAYRDAIQVRSAVAEELKIISEAFQLLGKSI